MVHGRRCEKIFYKFLPLEIGVKVDILKKKSLFNFNHADVTLEELLRELLNCERSLSLLMCLL